MPAAAAALGTSRATVAPDAAYATADRPERLIVRSARDAGRVKRSLVYHPPRTEEVIRTFTMVEQVEVFLLRRLHAVAEPYLRLPFLIFGTTDHLSAQAEPAPVVVLRPRVYVLGVPGEEGFELRVERPSTVTLEEDEPGRWRISEDFEPVEASQLRVWHIGRAWHARCDGFEELRIDHAAELVTPLSDGQPAPDRFEPPVLAAGRLGGAQDGPLRPLRYDWLRLSLEDPEKVRDEDSEMTLLASML